MFPSWLKLAVLVALYCAYWAPKVLFDLAQAMFYRKDVLFSYPSDVAQVPGGKPLLGVTLDDGPAWMFDKRPAAESSTEKIRLLLKKHNAKATWFIIGSHVTAREDRATLLKTLVSDGHELGNHGMMDRPAARLPREEFKTDTAACQQIIESAGSGKRKWYRPGHAVFTKFRKHWLTDNGYRIAIGNIYPHDALDLPPMQFPFPRLLSWVICTKAAAGDVLIIHDRPWTPKVLELSLPYLSERFQLCTLSTLADHCEPRLGKAEKSQ